MRAAVRRVAAVLLLGVAVGVPVSSRASATAGCSGSTFTVTRVSSPVLYLDLSVTPAVNSAYEGYQVTNSSGSAVGDVWVTSGTFSGPQIGLGTYSAGRSHIGAMAAGATAYTYFYLTAAGVTSSAETHTITVYSGRPDLGAAAVCSMSVSLTSTADISANANKVTAVSALPAPPQVGGNLTITVSGDAGTIGSAGIVATTPASYGAWRSDAFKLVGTQITIGGSTYTNVLYLSGLATGGLYTATFTFAVTGSTATSTPVSPMSHISSGVQVKHTAIDSTYTALPPIQSPVNQTTLGMSGTPGSLPPAGGNVAVTVPISNAGTTAVTLDDVTVTPASGEAVAAGSGAFNSVAVADPVVSGSTAVFVGQFTVPAGGSRSLTFTLTVPGSNGSYAASVTGHVASTQIDTTTSTADNAPASITTTVLPAPTVTSVSPATGTTHGGTSVTITGTNFAGVSAVRFGAAAAASYTVGSTSSITATTPAASAGTVDVTVTTGAGTSATSANDQYTFTTPPNSPPVYTAAGTNTSQSVAVGGTLTALAATDADGDSLTFTLTGGSLPPGVSLGSDGTFSGTVSSAGDTSATIQVSDGQGGTASTTLAVHAAVVPTVAITGGASVSTSDSTPTIAGTTNATDGSTVTVTVDNQTLTDAASSGTWSVTAATLADGTYTVTASYSTASATQSLTIDTTPPTIAITGGASRSTSDSTPAIAGTTNATDGSTVTVTVDNQTLTDTASSGTWSVTATTLADGTYTVGASVADSLGNTGTASQSLTVDTTAPTITITGGASVSTSDSTPTIAGTTNAPNGTTVTVTVGTQTLTGTAAGGAWSMTATILADGTYTVGASVADSLGNTATATQALTIDTTAPTITITGGASVSTSDTTPTIAGTTDGSTVTVTIDTQTLTATAAAGAWSVEAAVLAEGTYTVTASVADSLGNTATATQALTVAVPQVQDEETVGTGTSAQSIVVPVPPGGSVVLLDAHGNPTDSVTIEDEGRYDLDAPAARITFTPELGFTGTATPVRYRVTDAHGAQTEATYMPAVVAPPGPVASTVRSAGMAGQRQSVTVAVPAGGSITLLDAHRTATTTVTMDGQGTYDLEAATGVIAFTPLATFAGSATPVTYRITDAYGQIAESTYAPTVGAALPVTGTPVSAAILLAGALLAAGAVFIRAARR